MLSPERPKTNRCLDSTLSHASVSTPRSHKSEKLQEYAQLSPEPKNSRKKAYVNRLFSSAKKNVLNFDEPIQERLEAHEDDGDFEVQVQTIQEEPSPVAYHDYLAQTLLKMSMKESLTNQFINGNVRVTPPLNQVYDYIEMMCANFEYDTDQLDGQVMVSAEGSVVVRGNKIKLMHISALYRDTSIAEMKVQFI